MNLNYLKTVVALLLFVASVKAQTVSIGTPTSYGTSYDIAITLSSTTALSTWELNIEQQNGAVDGIVYIQIAGATVTTAPYVISNGNQITINNAGLGYGAIAAGGSVVVNCRILSTESSPSVDWIHFPDAGSTNGGGTGPIIIPNDQIWNNGGYTNFAKLNEDIYDLRIAAKTQIGAYYNGSVPASLSVLFPESNIISCSESADKRSVFWAKNYTYSYGFGIGDDNKGHIFQNMNSTSSVMTFENENVIIDQGSLSVDGVVGIGTPANPGTGLELLSNVGTALCVDQTNTADYGIGIIAKVANSLTKSFVVYNHTQGKDVFAVMGDGKLYATEINVKIAGSFPDYVFDSTYELTPLDSLKNFIKTNKHLPNMPTAATVEEEGANLGEVNRVLVEKVEELTLYTIKQQELIDELLKRMKDLEEKQEVVVE